MVVNSNPSTTISDIPWLVYADRPRDSYAVVRRSVTMPSPKSVTLCRLRASFHIFRRPTAAPRNHPPPPRRQDGAWWCVFSDDRFGAYRTDSGEWALYTDGGRRHRLSALYRRRPEKMGRQTRQDRQWERETQRESRSGIWNGTYSRMNVTWRICHWRPALTAFSLLEANLRCR